MHTGVKGAAPQSFLPTNEGGNEKRRFCRGDTKADSERHAIRAVNRQHTMNAQEIGKWRKVRTKKKIKVARPNVKLVVGARVAYKINIKDGEVE